MDANPKPPLAARLVLDALGTIGVAAVLTLAYWWVHHHG